MPVGGHLTAGGCWLSVSVAPGAANGERRSLRELTASWSLGADMNQEQGHLTIALLTFGPVNPVSLVREFSKGQEETVEESCVLS